MWKGQIILLSLAASLAMAGTVVLKDGSKVEGEMSRVARGWEIRQSDGKLVRVNEEDIASVAPGAATKPAPVATTLPSLPAGVADPLGALRKGVESQADLGVIIKRYELFIKQNEGKPYVAEAMADLAVWQDRQAKGMRKIGGAWGDPSKAREAFEKSTAELKQVVEAIKGDRISDANERVESLLAQGPQNPGALYLQGVIAARQNQISQARKSFEAAAAVAPWHGAALNNAAAMQWRQRAHGVALANLEKAMSAQPMCRAIHDNVAEVINSPAREVKNSAITARLAKLFESEDPRLQEEMEKQGLHRWGSTWITDARKAEIRGQEEADKKERARLATAVERAQAAFDKADADWRRHNGGVNLNPTDTRERTAEQQKARDNFWGDVLKRSRESAASRLDQAIAAQEQFRGNESSPSYSGQLRLMAEDFVFPDAPMAEK